MKGHKFKLEVVLKLRKMKEDMCKMELGSLQKRMNELNGFISGHEQDIEEAYKEQEDALKTGLSAQSLHRYPMMISEKRDHIKRINQEKEHLTEEIDQKVQELAKLKGDVKVISNMKDKSLDEYKKRINKKINENLEEQNQNWNTIEDII